MLTVQVGQLEKLLDSIPDSGVVWMRSKMAIPELSNRLSEKSASLVAIDLADGSVLVASSGSVGYISIEGNRVAPREETVFDGIAALSDAPAGEPKFAPESRETTFPFASLLRVKLRPDALLAHRELPDGRLELDVRWDVTGTLVDDWVVKLTISPSGWVERLEGPANTSVRAPDVAVEGLPRDFMRPAVVENYVVTHCGFMPDVRLADFAAVAARLRESVEGDVAEINRGEEETPPMLLMPGQLEDGVPITPPALLGEAGQAPSALPWIIVGGTLVVLGATGLWRRAR